MAQHEVRQRTGGRSAAVRKAVLGATLELAAENGPERVSMGEVARRAGVHETSVYRRWGTRERLLLDALLNYSEELVPVPDTGSLRGDLAAFACSVAAYLGTPLGSALAKALVVADDDPSSSASRDQFFEARVDAARVMFERASSRGEWRHCVGADSGLVLEALVAPVHFHVLFLRRPVDEDFALRLADLVIESAGGSGA
ncbi:TetR/AcrR family transcriptional regulator [Streptomyces sp. NBC_01005]|uniref:TetR/AcrR family transcriptional regulator n=1 Tax=unclassified Streptomyces TaxID=2593676 RepID=UPI002E3450E3|nr:TetR/AcrR family transcriptional regulator [Streptomyces sp. NBC_01362]WSW02901.1 TetR/AcrR family transcriptional regulator [Streptomyces sp. NBC_01005]WTC92409.1 TetR/AcrR family transcriptional regulator [Streptomyces sp. NBC_01650]